jgi:hypothetical protein
VREHANGPNRQPNMSWLTAPASVTADRPPKGWAMTNDMKQIFDDIATADCTRLQFTKGGAQ